MEDENWITGFEMELDKATQARASGNEGRARVCARRAAGIAASEYCRENSIPLIGNAFTRLAALLDHPKTPEKAREIIDHLLIRVDLEHHLPGSIDLIADTRLLPQALNLGTNQSSPTR